MKIAFVAGYLKMGGSTTLLLNLAKALKDKGVQIRVFSMEIDNPLGTLFDSNGIPVYCTNQHNTIFEDRLSRLLSLLATFAPDVVVATLGPSSFELLRYVPTGIIRGGLILADTAPVYKMVLKYANHLDFLAGNSKKIYQMLQAMEGFRKINKHFFVTGASPSPFPSPDFTAPLRIVVFSRMAREQKRIHLLPEIISRLSESKRPFHFTLAGDGPDLIWLKENIPLLAQGQTVHFTGAVPFDKVDDCLNGNHIFLLTSDYEGQPLALVHSMMNGVVPVVSDLESGIPELVFPGIGLLVNPSNIPGYSTSILQLDADREHLAALSRNARDLAEANFSSDTMARQWLDFLLRPQEKHPAWPSISIQPPLVDSRKWYYSFPVRSLRRCAIKLKKLLTIK